MSLSLPTTGVSSARGFSLIEVMIALVIFSIGLLGIAGLQTKGTQFSHTSHLLSVATGQAQDMMDRMLSNEQGLIDNNYANLAGIPGSVTNCSTTTCSAAQLAQYDLSAWNTANGAALPSGSGTVVCTDGNGSDTDACSQRSVYTITVRWDEERTGATGTGCGGNSSVDLRCYRLSFVY